ncbi:Phosphofructokinase subfamily [Synechococcus sp. PCC 7335]|uniref:ATP-dependent 6-phosphofructokinase n=1 Tax=Synechococcus sp. (strain ATCC 29403 / PCC 7335) TaxID=91464 RepID=UPI00017EDD68|nr:ATP-dependent 6-phosphofructokinase [Synechococcus sp. PCC 7335]EDX83605.1 Phosphofructokinase subfamily [Synechococcus sp. PCC 7335]
MTDPTSSQAHPDHDGKPKKIGILTSGGDCPGLNAAIRAVVRCATRRGWEVYGIPYGTQGLINLEKGVCSIRDLQLYDHGFDLPGLLHGVDILQFLSGSVLGALNKGNPSDPSVAKEILDGYQLLGLDALVALGGDGSLDIINDLAQRGHWNWIAIPKTIDNDVPLTERSLGFDTAVDTVTRALYDLTFTAASHSRIIVVQVMGRDAGHLALQSGIAGGADVILIPEITPQLSDAVVGDICQKIVSLRQKERQFALIVVAEGVRNQNGGKEKYISDVLAQQIQLYSQRLCNTNQPEYCYLKALETRATSLGHIQRSSMPSSFDRLLAAAFGREAVELIAAKKYQRLVVWSGGKVDSQPLSHIIPAIKARHLAHQCTRPVAVDSHWVRTAGDLGIYIGLFPDSKEKEPGSKEKENLAQNTKPSSHEVCHEVRQRVPR